jgi:hypothetical protein
LKLQHSDWRPKKDGFYSGADPKTTAWQLLDVERCKYKSLIVICFYSVLDPKLTALLIKRLLDLDRCKHKCLVEICFYSDTDPKLLLDKERLSNLLQIKQMGQFWGEKWQDGSRQVENNS